jgi:hypothetical protein
MYRGPAMIRVIPTTGPATAALDAVPVVTVGARSRFDFTAAAPGWTANNFRTSWLRITRGGTLVLFELPISENDADQIFVDVAGIAGLVLNTDTAEIVEPNIILAGDAADGNLGLLSIQSMGGSFGPTVVNNAFQFERLELDAIRAKGGGTMTFDRCRIRLSSRFEGLHLDFINCTQGSATSSLILDGGSVGRSGTLQSREDGAGNPINQGVNVMMMAQGAVLLNGLAYFVPLRGWSCQGANVAGTPALRVDNGFADISFADSTDANAFLHIAGVVATGIQARRGAIIRLGVAPRYSIAGAAGADFAVETGAAVTTADFQNAGIWASRLVRFDPTVVPPTGDPSMIYAA